MAGKLRAQWRNRDDDIVYYWPAGGLKRDARLINDMLFGLAGGTDVVGELRKRGYDITTLRFSIQLKEAKCDE